MLGIVFHILHDTRLNINDNNSKFSAQYSHFLLPSTPYRQDDTVEPEFGVAGIIGAVTATGEDRGADAFLSSREMVIFREVQIESRGDSGMEASISGLHFNFTDRKTNMNNRL